MVVSPRSFLFVPGDRPDLLAKAARYRPGAVIADLEDAVSPDSKDRARRTVEAWLFDNRDRSGFERWIRINNDAGSLFRQDLAWLSRLRHLEGVVVPKVESANPIREVLRAAPTARVLAMIESGRGLRAMDVIASSGAWKLTLGELDLASDLGLSPNEDEEELLPLRLHLTVVSTAAGLGPPVASVSPDFRDIEAFRRSCERHRRLGYCGRMAIHPRQVEVIESVFKPTSDEVAWARRVLERAEGSREAVFTDAEGRMVDEAVLKQARRILDQA